MRGHASKPVLSLGIGKPTWVHSHCPASAHSRPLLLAQAPPRLLCPPGDRKVTSHFHSREVSTGVFTELCGRHPPTEFGTFHPRPCPPPAETLSSGLSLPHLLHLQPRILGRPFLWPHTPLGEPPRPGAPLTVLCLSSCCLWPPTPAEARRPADLVSLTPAVEPGDPAWSVSLTEELSSPLPPPREVTPM